MILPQLLALRLLVPEHSGKVYPVSDALRPGGSVENICRAVDAKRKNVLGITRTVWVNEIYFWICSKVGQ